MNIEFLEAFIISKQYYKMKINIFSCQGGEGFKSCQVIDNAVITKQEYGIGIEIKDRERPDALVKIEYSRLKKVRIMELDDLILTFLYRTISIEVIIERDAVTGIRGIKPVDSIDFQQF